MPGDDEAALLTRYTAITGLEATGVDAGDLAVLWMRLSADAQRVLGPLGELALLARYGVARARRALGDDSGAVAEGDSVLAAQRHAYGDIHPATLDTRTSVAFWRGSDGDVPYARADLVQLVPALEDAFGHDSQNALFARNALGMWRASDTTVLECLSEATVLHEDVTRALGDSHPLTIQAGQVLEEQRARWSDWLTESRGVALDLLADMEFDEGHGERPEGGRGWADTSGLDDDAVDRVHEESAAMSAQDEQLLVRVTDAKRAASFAGRTFGNGTEAALSARYDVARAFMAGGPHGVVDAHRCAASLADDCTRILGARDPLTERVARLRDRAAVNRGGHFPAYGGTAD